MIDPIDVSRIHRSAAKNDGLKFAEAEESLNDGLVVPYWVMDSFGGARHHRRRVCMKTIDRECIVSTHALDAIVLVSVHLPAANDLNAERFRRGTGEIYHLIRSTLDATSSPHPVRMWNFIPGIHHQFDDGLDRYQVFNQARHAAFLQWLGDQARFASHLPTATGIGHAGDALVIHALATALPGRPHENPRQRPAFQYSQCWGPQPPCFSRAVIASLPNGMRLLIGGTSSVRGEESMHHGSLSGQLNELLENLRCLLAMIHQDRSGSLQAIREVRMYHRRHEDRDELCAAVGSEFTAARRIEVFQADICRRELLVEIEAVADICANGANQNGSRMNHCNHVSS